MRAQPKPRCEECGRVSTDEWVGFSHEIGKEVCWNCNQNAIADANAEAQIEVPDQRGGDGEIRPSENGAGPELERTSWAPIDLAPIIAGERAEEPPEILARTDGPCLLYQAKSHAIFAEPESGKSWLALLAAKEELEKGRGVLYLDFEDGPESVVGRLRNLGTEPKAIERRFFYTRPDEPLKDEIWTNELQPLLPVVSLAVIDGMTEALTLHGLDLGNNADVARWLDLLPRPLIREGCTPLSLDHVTKDKETRGRFAIGAQHKLAGVDVAYSMKMLRPFGRGIDGLVQISVEKDRPGYVRASAERGRVAEMRFSSGEEGAATIELCPPEREGEGEAFRPPTYIMDQVCNVLQQTPGLSKHGLEQAVKGKAATVRYAAELLEAEGAIRIEADGQARRHYFVPEEERE